MRTYDPNKIPDMDKDTIDRAAAQGLAPISVTCIEEGNADSGVTIGLFVDCVPRVGERIEIEDGTVCEVRRVYHKMVRLDGKLLTLMPNVFAVKIGKR